MLKKRKTLLIPFLGLVLLGCSGKSVTKRDASLPDAAADAAAVTDLPFDTAGIRDLPNENPSSPDTPPDAAGPTDRSLDLPVDLRLSPDAPSDAPDRQDVMADVMADATSVRDLVVDAGSAQDFNADARNPGDLPADPLPLGDGLADGKQDVVYEDACQAVANSTFRSVEEHECGLTPTGPATCQWTLAFTDKEPNRQVSWRLSDYSLLLSYQCSGFTITTSNVSGPGGVYTGTYNPATGILTFDKFTYAKVVR